MALLESFGSLFRILVILGLEDCFDEEIVGAAVGAGGVAFDRLSRPGGVDVRPLLGFVREDHGQLIHGDVGEKIILRVDHDGDSIRSNAEVDRVAVNGFAAGLLAVFDRAGGIGNIGFTGLAEALETSAGADRVNRNLAFVTFILEQISDCFREREDGGTTRGDDIAFNVAWVYLGQLNTSCCRCSGRRFSASSRNSISCICCRCAGCCRCSRVLSRFYRRGGGDAACGAQALNRTERATITDRTIVVERRIVYLLLEVDLSNFSFRTDHTTWGLTAV